VAVYPLSGEVAMNTPLGSVALIPSNAPSPFHRCALSNMLGNYQSINILTKAEILPPQSASSGVCRVFVPLPCLRGVA